MRYSLILLLLVAACAKSTPLPAINGKQAYFVECSGGAKSWSTCYEKANEVCHGTYKIVNKEQGKEANLSGGGVGSNTAFHGESGMDRSMTITCN